MKLLRKAADFLAAENETAENDTAENGPIVDQIRPTFGKFAQSGEVDDDGSGTIEFPESPAAEPHFP